MNRSKNSIRAVILGCFVVVFIIGYRLMIKRDKSLTEHYKTTTAIIKEVDFHKSAFLIFYKFYANHKETNYNTRLFVDNLSLKKLRSLFVGNDKFIVAYDSLNFDNSKLLLTEKEYEDFKLEPDTSVVAIFKEIGPYRIGSSRK